MPICPRKGQKGAKVGGAVGQNQLFCILLSKLAHWIFIIFCIKLEGIKLPRTTFFGKILIFPKKGKKGPKMGKNGLFGLLCQIESLFFARNYLK